MPISCPYCSREFPNSTRVSSRHLGICPKRPVVLTDPCLCGFRAVSNNKLKAHKRECSVWKSRDKRAHQAAQLKKTMLERHGVENPRQLEEAEERRKETCLERYGAENPFSRESSVFDKVQASLEGKRPVLRGEDNPFAKPEVQQKIRDYWMQEHGVENPQQVPEIRARTDATNLERYGGTLLGSDELSEKARKTNLERYGNEFPQRTEAIKERIRETNLERYGVSWTCMDPEVRAKQLETHHERYGSHWFASEEGKEVVRASMREKYGVEFPGAMEGHWDRLVETFRERYGVDHPLQRVEFLEKMFDTKRAKYGSPWGPQAKDGPNGLEKKVLALAPADSLIFTGDLTLFFNLPRYGRNKNPDFIVPGPDHTNPKKGVTKVVEAFGDFWHSRIFTGKAPFDHEQDLIEAYAEVGIECLVIWESEVQSNPDSVRSRLTEFLE